ncbi:dipeptide epimerase [Flammeovirgaceae bacterium SG7u.111]|nr:dipeptide epimerase [Flammeovirgaceae bacterium SG7u.132]WPO38051.1 dipeptide epimerase [Flammeovirgaceae bacterium SG7u.111]
MKLTLHKFDLRLKNTFRIAHSARDVQETLVVELEHDGVIGYGEATASTYYNVPRQENWNALEEAAKQLPSEFPETPQALWEQMNEVLKGHSFAQCALDIAAWDWYGKKLGKPLYEIWELDATKKPMTNYTLGIDEVERMIEKMKAMPWPLYKIKLGTEHDLEIVKALRKHTDAIFRIDANCAWEAEQAIRFSEEMKQLGVEFLEQPLKAANTEGMKEVFKHSALPCLADESCILPEDVANCAGSFHGVNIKLTKCGGLTTALGMIKEARGLGMKVMAGCMTESTVGVSAVAQLAPLLDFIDADGPLLLKADIADGVRFNNGEIIYADKNGTGVSLRK